MWGWSGKGRTGRRRATCCLGQGSPEGSHLQVGMAVGTGKAATHACEGPRHPGPGKGYYGNEGSDESPGWDWGAPCGQC